MRFVTPEISWHGREPLYSVDFQYCSDNMYKIASCGTDRFVRIWEVKVGNDGRGSIHFLSNLNRHTRTVNCVRFSPDGTLLASAGDDSVILLWKQSTTPPPHSNLFQEDEEENKETWTVIKTLRSHLEDVYDICWSSDGRYIISGSVDNTAILWDIKKGQKIWIFTEHNSFVQGVAFDPLGQYLATMSCDRILRIYNFNSRGCVHSIKKTVLPNGNNNEGEKMKPVFMFHDNGLKSFFRRLSFSPDGQLLVVPAGCLEKDGEQSASNTTFVFTRTSLNKPVLHLPSLDKSSLVVRFSPVFYQLRKIAKPVTGEQTDTSNESEKPKEHKEWEKYDTLFSLPYRMIFAVATEDSVLLYDTQQQQPFGYISNIHYHQLSDLTWSKDGKVLIISSTDGYCTIVTFSDGELGVLYENQTKMKQKPNLLNDVSENNLDPSVNPTSSKESEVSIKPTELAVSETQPTESSHNKNSSFVSEEKDKSKPIHRWDPNSVTSVSKPSPKSKSKPPRRIQVITLSSASSSSSPDHKGSQLDKDEATISQTHNESMDSNSSPEKNMHSLGTETASERETPLQTMKLESKEHNSDKKKPRHVEVTTVDTFHKDNGLESCVDEIEEVSLHLVLETTSDDTMPNTLSSVPDEHPTTSTDHPTASSTTISTSTTSENPKSVLSQTPTRQKTVRESPSNKKIPRRIQTVLLQSPKQMKNKPEEK